MQQMMVVTNSYKWEYDVCGMDGEIGIISKADYQQRVDAISSGEYKPSYDEPRTWHATWPDRGAWPDVRFDKTKEQQGLDRLTALLVKGVEG